MENAVKVTKRFFKGLSGVDNVFTQHKPVLHETLEELLKGSLKDNLYPCISKYMLNEKPQDIIVFMVGGCTYEESLTVHQFNKNYPGVNIILGGTFVHNSSSFIAEIQQAVKNVPRKYNRNIRSTRSD